MNASDHAINTPVATTWPDPLNARELDARYPGLLDGISGLYGGAANVIMQLASPAVGYGVMESRVEGGQIFRHPIKRTRTTFTFLAVAILGTGDEKLAYRKAVSRVHAQVYSTQQSPVQYRALDPELQLWVAACLCFGVLDTWTRLRGRPDPAELEALYQRLATLGTTLQVRPGMWPADLAAFNTYWEQGLARIHIDDAVRAYLTQLADLKFLHPALSRTLGPFHRFVATGFLPPKLREEMHFTWGPEQQKKFDRMLAATALINKHLPRVVRQFPFNLVLWDFRQRMKKGKALV
jgi:uncharacterized protein (DUF2236 family)